MFKLDSRYYKLETKTYTDHDGRVISYKKRRLVPNGEEMLIMAKVSVQKNERLDLVTNRTLGDPEHFWRICDANNAIEPAELTEQAESLLNIPIPQPE